MTTIVLNKLQKEIFEEHNKIRQNPKSYVPLLKNILKLFKGKVIHKPGEIPLETFEGPEVYEDCISFLQKQKPLKPLQLSDGLSRAALDHAVGIGENNLESHDGSDGSKVDERIERYVTWESGIAENIDFGGKTGEEVIISLIVDDGNPDRGHRLTIFSDEYFFVGIGLAKHVDYEICTVLDYAGGVSNQKKIGKLDMGVIKLSAPGDSPKRGSVTTSPKREEEKGKKEDRNKDRGDRDREPGRITLESGPKVEPIKVQLNLRPGDFLFSKKPELKDDPDKPKDAVDVKIKTLIKKANGKVLINITKTYTLKNGNQEIVEIEERQE